MLLMLVLELHTSDPGYVMGLCILEWLRSLLSVLLIGGAGDWGRGWGVVVRLARLLLLSLMLFFYPASFMLFTFVCVTGSRVYFFGAEGFSLA